MLLTHDNHFSVFSTRPQKSMGLFNFAIAVSTECHTLPQAIRTQASVMMTVEELPIQTSLSS